MRPLPKARLFAFVLIAGVYTLGFVDSPMPAIQGDGYYTWIWARSLAFDGDLDLTNDYALCGDPWGMAPPLEKGLGPQNQWNPGPAIVWTPLLLVGRLVHPDARSDDRAIAGACRGGLAQLGVFGTVLMALLALVLAFRMARRVVGEGPALLGVLGVAFASPLPYYSCFLASYGHAPSAFGVALFLERWDATRGQRGTGRWALLGALLGLAMLMRPQNAVIAVAPLLEWIGWTSQAWRVRRARGVLGPVLTGVLFTVAALVVFSPQMFIWKHAYGAILAVPQGPHYMRWGESSLDGVLFASTGGLLVWTPLLWLSLVGLILGLFRYTVRPSVVPMVLITLLTLYVNGAVWDYWGSMGFSNRRFTFLALPFAFGLAFFSEVVFRVAERHPRRMAGAALATVVLLFGMWNYAAMQGVATYRIKSWREAPTEDRWNEIFAELSRGVWRRVGNPFAWPASVPFAVAHRVHPRHYDAMRGMSIYYAEYQDRSPREGEATAEFTTRLHSQYLVEGFDEDPRDVRGERAVVARGPRARMLIPFFIEDLHAIEMHWAAARPSRNDPPAREDRGRGTKRLRKPIRTKGARPRALRAQREPTRVVLSWNGVRLAQLDVPPRWTRTRIFIPEGLVRPGVNELTWTIYGPPLAIESLEALP